jgi:glutamate-1-semialdehyde 2,1-aminomutase
MIYKYSPMGIHKLAKGMDFDNVPNFIVRAKDCYIFDEQRNKFLDFSMGKGSVTLGHANKKLIKSLLLQAKNGQQFTLPPLIYELLAKKLTSLLSSYENKCLFFKNGTDAVRASLRLARAHTKKKIVLTSGYHSWHDEFLPSAWPRDGALEEESGCLINFYYSLTNLGKLLAQYKNNIAAILITPEPGLVPREFYEEIQHICAKENIPFIMDEVKCGFHVRTFGVSEYYQLKPDLILLSKGMANGYPISAVIGKPSIIDTSDRSIIFGTYFYDTFGLALALRTIKIYEDSEVCSYLEQIGSLFYKELSSVFEKTATNARIIGHPSMPILIFANKQEQDWYYSKLIENGIFSQPNDNIGLSISHRHKAIFRFVEMSESILSLKPSSFRYNKYSLSSGIEAVWNRKMITHNHYLPEFINESD